MRPNRLIMLCGGLAVIAIAAAATPAMARSQPEPAVAIPASVVRGEVEAIVAAGAPGVNVRIGDESGTRAFVAGVGDLGNGSAPDPGGRFRIGSVTKTFTATLVLQLVGDGRIALDAPVERYLPGLLPYRQKITVRQLLQHRTGLFDYKEVLWPDMRAEAAGRFKSYTPAQLVHIATARPLQVDEPGGEFFYSNTDYIVLGMLAEKVAHRSIAAQLRSRILQPAGLRHTYLATADPSLAHPSARGYETVDPAGPLIDFTSYNMTASWATGAIVSTTDDVNRFFRVLLTGGLLRRAELAEMQRTVPAFPGYGYGLGIASTTFCGQTVWGHVGGVPGYQTYSFTRADGGRQITVSINRSETLDQRADAAANTLIANEFCRS
jgi:D-alanyl-D-alanine carboxypeptidase